jgi:hypothetical protein
MRNEHVGKPEPIVVPGFTRTLASYQDIAALSINDGDPAEGAGQEPEPLQMVALECELERVQREMVRVCQTSFRAPTPPSFRACRGI